MANLGFHVGGGTTPQKDTLIPVNPHISAFTTPPPKSHKIEEIFVRMGGARPERPFCIRQWELLRSPCIGLCKGIYLRTRVVRRITPVKLQARTLYLSKRP